MVFLWMYAFPNYKGYVICGIKVVHTMFAISKVIINENSTTGPFQKLQVFHEVIIVISKQN